MLLVQDEHDLKGTSQTGVGPAVQQQTYTTGLCLTHE